MTSIGYHYYHDDPSQASLSEISAVLGGELVNAWLEDPLHPDGLCLRTDLQCADVAVLMHSWPMGRLFSESGDLRWERHLNGDLHIVLITDGTLPSDFQGVLSMQLIDQADVLLWGKQHNGVLQEGRIPDLARWYPDEWQKGPYVALRTERYEAPWQAAATSRIITRYRCYLVPYAPDTDARFQKG